MRLAGDLAEFSLADLVQVAGVAGRTCCVRVLAADGNGTLYLQGGEVVSATFEDLSGFDAFVALVEARAGHFQVENGAVPERRNMQGNVQKLLLEANARIESGAVPTPRRQERSGAGLPVPAAAPAPRPVAAGSGGRRLWIGGAAALLLVAAVSWLAFARHDVAAGAGGTGDNNRERPERSAGGDGPGPGATPGRPAVEATQLTGPRDAPPALVSGSPPPSPDPTSGLKPTIVCRLLVDAGGSVAEAKIYRSRLDLAAFEDAALDAVRRYRFRPGRLAGAPVAVWINWPVTFP